MIIELILFCIVFIVAFIYLEQDPPDYPPGPLRIPIIGGGIPNNDERIEKQQKVYGDLILDKIGKFYWLTICDYKLVKEALFKTELQDRPQIQAFMDQTDKKMLGVSNTNGTHWKSNRRFVLHHLRDHGMGKSSIEDSLHEEAIELLSEFKLRAGSTTSLKFINFATANIIWKIVANKRYNVRDPRLERYQHFNQLFTKYLGHIITLQFFPSLEKYIPTYLINLIFKRDSLDKMAVELISITQPVIEEHLKNVDRNKPKDIMEQYCSERETSKYLIPEHMSDNDLRGIANDLFSAGSETVSITLRWAILFLAKYPQIQTKMQQEIDSVVPREKLPGYEHKNRLPYCQAFIHETLRKSSLLNIMMRMNSQEIYLGGYRIPKDTFVTCAISFIHHDPRYWKNPQEFIPERFLDYNGKFLCPKEGFMPFGLGRRQCIGAGLARAELYTFVTAMVQNFVFSPPADQVIDLRVIASGFGLHIPISHEVHVQARNTVTT